MLNRQQPKNSVIPTPEVQHLTTVFRRIQNGEIKIPAFQRGFVWKDQQVIEILGSVYKGYPIGSVLFWKEGGSTKIELTTVDAESTSGELTPVPFPHVESTNSVSYVLDGMQRLSALYGVFFAPDLDKKFNVVFDLIDKEFLFSDVVDSSSARFIQLSYLFQPRRMLEAQGRMAGDADSERLIDASIELLSTFQDYLLAIVNISASTIEEVVEIFERVNNTGTKLSRVDFMRALTWSGNFDLNSETRRLRAYFAQQNFNFALETYVKILSLLLGKDPTLESMLTLRGSDSDTLHNGIVRTKNVMEAVTGFLCKQCGILSSDFVPYEGQILVLVKVFDTFRTPSEEVLDIARRWFWSTSFSESLRGKPDNYVVRSINSVTAIDGDGQIGLFQRLSLTPDTIIERRLIREKSLSSAIAASFSQTRARSLLTGDLIDPEEYMVEFDPRNFEPILSKSWISRFSRKEVPSAKTLANICLVSTADRARMKITGQSNRELITNIYSRFSDQDAREILASQMLPEDTQYIEDPTKFDTFLFGRAITMYDVAAALVLRSSDHLNGTSEQTGSIAQ